MSSAGVLNAYPDMVASFLDHSLSFVVLLLDKTHRILDCNEGFYRSIQLQDRPVHMDIRQLLSPVEQNENASLSHISGSTKETIPQMLKHIPTDTLFRFHIFDISEGYLLLGELVSSSDNRILEQMSELSNSLSNLSRELSKKNRRLEKANLRIRELMNTDPLTDLANRRHFQSRYQEWTSVAVRHHSPLSIIMADLDHFKHINDGYGHAAGDQVLKRFGRMLKIFSRKEDLPARFGGEEFIVLLPHTTGDEAFHLGNRIRQELASEDILGDGRRITVSMGIAEWNATESFDILVKRADAALYEAKKRGRNQCVKA